MAVTEIKLPCKTYLQLADISYQFLRENEYNKTVDDAYSKAFDYLAHCISTNYGSYDKAEIEKMIEAKRNVLEKIKELIPLPVYDAQVLAEIQKGFERLFVVAVHKPSAGNKAFLEAAGKLLKTVETNPSNLTTMVDDWQRFRTGDNIFTKSLKGDDIFAAKLLMVSGISSKLVEQIYPPPVAAQK